MILLKQRKLDQKLHRLDNLKMYPKNLEILGKNKILICTHGKNNMQPLKEKFHKKHIKKINTEPA